MRRLVATPFGVAVLALVALAGWALWTAGIFDDGLQRATRNGSVYAAPGSGVDVAAAAHVLGNRRLVVAFLDPDTDKPAACADTAGPADGTLVFLLSRGKDDYDTYGCSQLPGHDDDNFGKAFVAETTIGRGIDEFTDRPVDALKVIAVNYDQLVKAGLIPDGARSISPSLPRYLVAVAAIAAVLAGSALAYAAARRAGRLAATRRANRDDAEDARGSLHARVAVLAQHIIELDGRYARAARRPGFRAKYRRLAADYAELVTKLDDHDERALGRRIKSLTDRCEDLAT